jgi:hypothetical protein
MEEQHNFNPADDPKPCCDRRRDAILDKVRAKLAEADKRVQFFKHDQASHIYALAVYNHFRALISELEEEFGSKNENTK